ncbi:hypothetical protein COP1_046619 [Malus domestica]
MIEILLLPLVVTTTTLIVSDEGVERDRVMVVECRSEGEIGPKLEATSHFSASAKTLYRKKKRANTQSCSCSSGITDQPWVRDPHFFPFFMWIFSIFDWSATVGECCAGKVHGSLARAGKVRGQTPKVAKQDKKKKPRGRAHKRLQYNRRFVTAVVGFGKKRGPNSSEK